MLKIIKEMSYFWSVQGRENPSTSLTADWGWESCLDVTHWNGTGKWKEPVIKITGGKTDRMNWREVCRDSNGFRSLNNSVLKSHQILHNCCQISVQCVWINSYYSIIFDSVWKSLIWAMLFHPLDLIISECSLAQISSPLDTNLL